MQLSNNFSLSEFTASQTAARFGIDNTPTSAHIEALRMLVVHVLQPIRDQFGPVIVTSGYRSPEVNRRIGGAANSQHSNGEAADIKCLSISNADLAAWIRDNLSFDQLILEAYHKGQPHSGWVHVSYRNRNVNRKQVLTATFVNGRAQYSNGLNF